MNVLKDFSQELIDGLLRLEVKILQFMTSPAWLTTDVDSQAKLRLLLQSVVDCREMAEDRIDG